MDNPVRKKNTTRIELRVTKEDKELFEHASALRGFNSFSEFARLAIYKEAKAIVEEESSILVSLRDKEIFFGALMGVEEPPNEALRSAIAYHKKLVDKS
ncbi:MAG: DUF1778 domain-containing protein [Bacteroidota bacterium]|nr:DUF1778 domain-containing protein [Bacteroidota bacterium]